VKEISVTTVIRGTPLDVWSVLTDFAKYPEWNPFIREASGDIEVGSRLRVRIHPPGGNPMAFRPKLVRVVPERELRWLGHLVVPGVFDGEHAFRIEPAGVGEVLFVQSEEFRGVLASVFVGSMADRIRRGFEAMNRALQERIERRQ
jgi:hypothetical protein